MVKYLKNTLLNILSLTLFTLVYKNYVLDNSLFYYLLNHYKFCDQVSFKNDDYRIRYIV